MRHRSVLLASAVLVAAGCGTSGGRVVAVPPPPPAEPSPPTGPPASAGPNGSTNVPTGDDAKLLAALRVAAEADPGGYDREAFGYPDGGTDSRGCSTRARVLIRDSTVPAQVAYPGCKVLSGRWVDSYTGTTYEDLTKVSIDHLVPLKQAWVSGAASWPAARLVAFGNDVERVEALKVIGGSGNASKGDKDPARWMPPLRSAWPAYARAWLTVKVAYGLTADQAEVDALRAMLAATAGPSSTTTASTSSTTAAAAPDPATTGTAAVYYPSCAAVRAAGKAPLQRGDPGYRAGLDGDGVICTA